MESREEAFDRIIDYERNLHRKNQKRIKMGIRLLLIIPLIFLAIMFRMESNKVVFLTLWIASLFAIAFYLIGIEYMDYALQKKLREFGIRDEDEEIDGLIDDRMDVERIIRVANAIQESLTLEDKEKGNDNVAMLEDKNESHESAEERPRPKKRPRPEEIKTSNPERTGSHEARPNPEQRRRPRPASEEQRKASSERINRNESKTQNKKPNVQMREDAMKEFINQVGVEAAEEELMASIKRYVAEVNTSDQPIVVEPKKTASDYAQMRKKRAQQRYEENEEE